jgi:phage minor structural protein
MDRKCERIQNATEVVDEDMTPVLYEPRETDFSHNGLGFLSDTTRCDVTEEANGKYELELEYPLLSRFSSYFDNGYQIKAKPNDQEEYHIFEIKNTYKDSVNNSILIYAQSRTYKLGNREVQHVEIKSKNGASAMASIEQGMDEPSDIKLYSDITTTSSTVFEARNVLNCIAGEQGSLLQYWGGEMKREPFKFSLLRRRGRDKVGTVRYGKDLQGLKIKFDWASIVTKVLPYADLQNDGDGTTKRIYGSPVLSELVKNYPDIYCRHIQFTEEQGVKDLASLNRVAKNYFKSINPDSDKPKISIELEIEKLTDSEEAKEFSKIKNYGLFDTFSVYHGLYDIEIDTKITSVVYDSLNEKNKSIHAGDARLAFYQQQNYELQETIKTLAKKGYMSEFVDYVTSIISGNDGGHVIWWPKNRPTDLFFCDQPELENAKQVLRINKSGVGFSSNGWKGPFGTAWTLDGIFVADYITAGILKGILVEGNLLKSAQPDQHYQTVIDNGDLSIQEYSKTPSDLDYNDPKWKDRVKGKQIVRFSGIYTDGKPTGATIAQYPGQKLSLSSSNEEHVSKTVFLIPDDSTKDQRKYILTGDGTFNDGKLVFNGPITFRNTVIFEKDVEFKSNVTVGRRLDTKVLYVNDVRIDTNGGNSGGGGGGSWNGQYPPEITSDRDKRYWQIWAMAISAGFSKQAAAALLGNAQGESDANPTADEGGGRPGFGYGVWQWTDSSGASSGRIYMINLMTQAGISDDPDTI